MRKHPESAVVVFAVWEPILPSDWGKPGGRALQRLSDTRVRQFWDSDHTVAGAIKTVESGGKLHPSCCERKGVLWDLTAAYAPGALWGETLPEPVFLEGPVVKTVAELGSLLSNAK